MACRSLHHPRLAHRSSFWSFHPKARPVLNATFLMKPNSRLFANNSECSIVIFMIHSSALELPMMIIDRRSSMAGR
jgi:hypothetical protein